MLYEINYMSLQSVYCSVIIPYRGLHLLRGSLLGISSAPVHYKDCPDFMGLKSNDVMMS